MAFRVNGSNTIISTNGRIGVGNTNLFANVQIEGSASNTLLFVKQSGSGLAMNIAGGQTHINGVLNIFSDVAFTGNLYFNGVGTTIWTSQNDGSGSGLDADLLDGNNSNFSTNATNFTTGTLPSGRLSGAYTGIQAVGTLTDLDVTGNVTFSRNLTVVGRMNIANQIYVGSNTVWHSGTLDIGANTVWHSGNDGAGSGVDAGLLAGRDQSYYADGINAAYQLATTGFGVATAALSTTLGGTVSGPVEFASNLSVTSLSTFSVDAIGGRIGIGVAQPSINTLTKLQMVVNTETQLAIAVAGGQNRINNKVILDLTPGSTTPNTRSAQIIAEAEVGPTAAALVFATQNGSIPVERMRINRNGLVSINAPANYNVGAQLYVSGNAYFTGAINVGGNTVWHSGNDGINSALDAGLFAGQNPEYYTSANNLNSGTVPAARVSGNYSSITGVGTLPQLVIADSHILEANGSFIRGAVTDLGVGSYGIQQHGQTSIGSKVLSAGYYNSVSAVPAYYTFKNRGTKSAPASIDIDDDVGSFRSYANSGSGLPLLVAGLDISSNSEGGATITAGSKVPGRAALGVTTNTGTYTEALVIDNRANVHVPTILHIGGVRQFGLVAFCVQMRYATGAVQHRIGRIGDASQDTRLYGKLGTTSSTYANTNVSTDSSSGFNSLGMKVSTTGTNRLIFNTSDQVEIFNAFQGIATVAIPNAGSGVGTILGGVVPRITSRNVNGTTQYRLEADLYTLNGSDFDIATRLAAGESFAINFLVGLV